MLLSKMVRSVRLIQNYRLKTDKYKQGSLTVVAVIFVGILLSCLMFQLAAYKQEMGSITRITEHERRMRQDVIQMRHKNDVHSKHTSGHE
ncbi:hypothetical protein [Lentilactobacillus otakiensis]|uniref:hypothetical protein n=1 Tax=Lentilactobacillus otakiensis TaxID=481720 RepID=UPI000402C7C7|nr:hypothetical protein [Lentilactobacillus otakiensis]MBZ3775681.1 hypothetical protein [Lentilactobacillus otakiensis]MDV3518900.1 hypothetical protein [Lentilactobacillus otakiensis]